MWGRSGRPCAPARIAAPASPSSGRSCVTSIPPPPDATEHPFAGFVRILGRGPGRSRALTREEARTALGMVLRGEADPHQIGAFLMLLRYRGEDPDEIAGLVDAIAQQ